MFVFEMEMAGSRSLKPRRLLILMLATICLMHLNQVEAFVFRKISENGATFALKGSFFLDQKRPAVRRRLVVRHLNRILFEASEVETAEDGMCHAIIPKDDKRAKHIHKILKLPSGGSIRAGVLDAGKEDNAVIEWAEENPKTASDLLVRLGRAKEILKPLDEDDRPHVSLLLALPRPLQLERILPVVAQLGVRRLVLTGARKVPKEYFGSHLFWPERAGELRGLLADGLAQCGDTAVPTVAVAKRLKYFLEDDLDTTFPRDRYLRALAHPDRPSGRPAPRLSALPPPPGVVPAGEGEGEGAAKVLLAVGPEGGWDEPDELDLFAHHGFQCVSLGPRVLRSDVAVAALLALAHDWRDRHRRLPTSSPSSPP